MSGASKDGIFLRPGPAFLSSPSVSIDYAVMEKTDKAAVVVDLELGWSDLGSWQAVWEVGAKDEHGNVLAGPVLALSSEGSLLRSETEQLIAAVGVKDIVAVATRDAVLLMPKDRAQDIRRLIAALDEAGSDKHRSHAKVHRPWGTYESIDRGERYQTKRIVVKPGGQLSLQMHHHRSEHWIVVRGTARVTIDDRVTMLHENESTYIPAGERHRLENPGKIPLELIEVQCGTYLGEDDIVRYDDRYGREADAGSPK
jgi:mannose-1-phosphate guanylyltransferase/mannose-6-phosphate isomerase